MKLLSLIIALSLGFCAFSSTPNIKAEILAYLQLHSTDWKLTKADFTDIEITSEASSKAEGVKHVYVRQLVNGVPVINGLGTVTLKNNHVNRVSARFVPIVTSSLSAPKLSAQSALDALLKQLSISGNVPDLLSENAQKGSFIFAKGTVSKEPIPMRLFLKSEKGTLAYVWETSIYPVSGNNWWSLQLSAENGKIVFQSDWVQHCSFDACEEQTHQHGFQSPSPLMPPPPPGADQYTVYALPLVSPNHGNRTTLVNPSDPTFSPFGWHDDNGVVGDEYTITRGNNVYASEDINNADVPGYSPDGGAGLNFDFAYDSAVGVQGNLDAVITNLFYMNNMMHDIWAYYGFDEESGNFQALNYSNLGLGNDFVFADAQDGSGSNNANFGTPPDGSNPRMQMYLWSSNNVPNLLTANAPSGIAGSYNCSTAGFGPAVPTTPITADLVLAIDNAGDTLDGCDPIINAAQLSGKIALLKRGSCQFTTKVEACQNAGALAVIVYNNAGGNPISMGGASSTITIPSIMVSKADGELFIASMQAGDIVNVTLVNPGDLSAEDSDFDNLVIAHEYGHGISNRLTGGADNTDCLYNAEQMGEGWSDWFGLMLTMNTTDLPTDPRGVGTYVTNVPNNATGIRPAPYSTDFAVNNYTYANTNSGVSQPHGIGFVWATMLWDLNWAFIDQYGFDANVKTGTGGNNKLMALVIEGLKLQPCGPGFVDGRDAILAADELLNNGVNKCMIWEVFAKRGLGYSADQGNPDDRTDQIEAFDLPNSCSGSGLGVNENAIGLIKVYPNPSEGVFTIDLSKLSSVSDISISDVTGKSIANYKNVDSKKLSFDLSANRAGMYFIQVQSEEGVTRLEIIKN